MFCYNCGSIVEAGRTACQNCGAPIANDGGHGATGGARGPMPAGGVRTATIWENPYGAPPQPRPSARARDLVVSFIEDGAIVTETTLDLARATTLRFGSAADNDLVVAPPSHTVSGHHGVIMVRDGWCHLQDSGSLNGLYLNGTKQKSLRVAAGDVVSIGRPKRGARRCVMVFSDAEMSRNLFSLADKHQVTIGRTEENDLTIPDPTVSARHALLQRDGTGWMLVDQGSTNGTQVDGSFITSRPLFSGSVINFGNTQAVFLDECLLVVTERHGVDVVAQNLVRYRKNGKETRITTNHISLHIKRGEFVAIVGGSGCGKSTLLNELNGSEPADEGSVTLDGTDLYANYKMLKSSIGYVPQEDIVYDNLRLEDMLAFAAKLRMQPDTTPQERAARVEEVIALLELDHVRQNLIGKLSGGQKKRASIAVELLADPRLLFLDEPTSGLDPGIERKLMVRLSEMAHEGRTIILVTHTTLNLHLCDQVVFLGTGGRLCYAGNPAGAMPFFGVTDFVEVYPKIEEDPELWERRFASGPGRDIHMIDSTPSGESAIGGKSSTSFLRQFLTLSARYAKLLFNDRARLLLLVGQPPFLAALINLVAAAGVFDVCEDTKFYLFALSCAAFWVGIFDSIQEICKENSIFQRECDGGLRIGAYLASKVLVQGALCLVQTLLLVAVLLLTVGTPQNALFSPSIELVISTYLTVLSAMALGLLVSAIFRSPDKALAVAPILIMPQILFSGIAFELNDVTEKISYGINCRWAIEALGTTADLNSLDLAIYGEEITVPPEKRVLNDQDIEVPDMKKEVEIDTPAGKQKQTVTIDKHMEHFDEIEADVPEITKVVDSTMLEHEVDDMFEHSMDHLARSWGILLGMSLLCIGGCYAVLVWNMKK